MLICMKKCSCKQACNTLSHSNQRMAELTLKIIITGYGIGSVNMLY